MAACSTCRAPILWRKNVKTGKSIPIDRDPIPGGNIILVGDKECRFLSRDEVASGAGFSQTSFASHYATCPNADEHRKPKA